MFLAQKCPSVSIHESHGQVHVGHAPEAVCSQASVCLQQVFEKLIGADRDWTFQATNDWERLKKICRPAALYSSSLFSSDWIVNVYQVDFSVVNFCMRVPLKGSHAGYFGGWIPQKRFFPYWDEDLWTSATFAKPRMSVCDWLTDLIAHVRGRGGHCVAFKPCDLIRWKLSLSLGHARVHL